MLPLIDLSARQSISNTAYDDTNRYRFEAPLGSYIWLTEISLIFDSNFQTNGRFQGFISGKSFTQQAGVLTEVQPAANVITMRARDDELWILGPSEALEIKYRVAAASGVVQDMITGSVLTAEEYRALLQRKGLVQ